MILQLLLSCLCALLTPLAFAQATVNPVKSIRLEMPRAYGYVIGDVIHQQAELEIAKNYKLDGSALPRPGPINRWLNLRQIRTLREAGSNIDHYRIQLDYQIFYAPVTVKNLTIPALDLRFSDAAEETNASIPSWSFSISPLHESGIQSESGLPVLRPEAAPVIVTALADWLMLWLGIATALLAVVYLGYLNIWLAYWIRGKHFVDACKILRRMELSPLSNTQMRAAFGCMHQAFNVSNQAPLFSEGLDGFFTRCPHYRPLRSEIEDFYRASYDLFFGDDAQPGTAFPLERMVKLCQACLRIEREQQ